MTSKLSTISIPNRYGDSFEIILPKWYYAVLVDELYSYILSGFPTLEVTPSTDSALECLDRHVHPEEYMRSDFAGHSAMAPGACFAGELVPAWRGAKFDVLRVDNAWANLSDSFIRAAVYQFGSAVNFGPTYTWVTRAVVERAIGNIGRLTGKAVGSTPTVDLGRLRLALDESCKEHNTSPTERLNHSSPIDAITHALQQPDVGLIALPLPRETVEHGRMLDYLFEETIRGNIKSGVNPYVETLYRRYGPEANGEPLPIGGRPVRVHGSIKRYDVRLCEAGVVGGKWLGKLVADRYQDHLFGVRDAIHLRRSGNRRKALKKLEKAAAKAQARQSGTNKKKPDREALGIAKADQSRGLRGDRNPSEIVGQSAIPSQTTDAPPEFPSRWQEPELGAWSKKQVVSSTVTRRFPSRERMLSPWSPLAGTSSKRRGGKS